MASRGICLFGGTFDPPHASHRRVVEAALRTLGPARIVVVPCGDHPLKVRDDVSPAADRVAMCRLAFADLPRVEVSTIEVDRGGLSYTVDTIRHYRAELGLEEPIYVLIGSDNVAQLPQWHQPETIFELATIVTFPRRGHPLTERALRAVNIRYRHKQHLLEHALKDVAADAVSSTEVRRRIARGDAVADLAPAVLAYVREHGLYDSGAAPAG